MCPSLYILSIIVNVWSHLTILAVIMGMACRYWFPILLLSLIVHYTALHTVGHLLIHRGTLQLQWQYNWAILEYLCQTMNMNKCCHEPEVSAGWASVQWDKAKYIRNCCVCALLCESVCVCVSNHIRIIIMSVQIIIC